MREDVDLYLELADFRREGIRLILDGRESSPAEIADACMLCEADYMRDYITDGRGNVSEIRFLRLDETNR